MKSNRPRIPRAGKKAKASLENLLRIFTVPESEDSTLARIERAISDNLEGFLNDHVVSGELEPAQMEASFLDTEIPDQPIFVSEQAEFILNHVVSQSVHTSSPRFIGHMTSAIPYFMISLGKVMLALNQNVVKIETSKAFTPLERQVIAMLHRLVYGLKASDYQDQIHHRERVWGIFCSGGTVANLTCLWAARNHCFAPRPDFLGVSEQGWHRALSHYGYQDAVVLISERGHYSFAKSMDILGLGKQSLWAIPTDEQHKMRIDLLEDAIRRCQQQNIKVLAMVGIAGTTETGSVDPLEEMAQLARTHGIWFHVDAAWGGPTLFSRQHRHLLDGIQQADSVIIDAHKQLYVPLSSGLVLFKDPTIARSIEQSAQYVVRKGSRDLGRFSLEGSRPGFSLLVHSGLRVIGQKGYELLIDRGIALAQCFAEKIVAHPDFELISPPELNLLCYRYVPAALQKTWPHDEATLSRKVNDLVNSWTIAIQKQQRTEGNSFVSRTQIPVARYDRQRINVFRVVLANPLSTEDILDEVLAEQSRIGRGIYQNDFAARLAELLPVI